jgi:hypothetical protein
MQGLRIVGCFALCLLGLGCDRKDSTAGLAPQASSLATSPPVPTANVARYVVDAKGTTTINMKAPIEEIKADTTVAAGELSIDLTNLVNTRGKIQADLTTLKTHTFKDDDKNSSQTSHALNWLEVGDVAAPEAKEANRWVVFALRSVEEPSATDVSKVPPVREGTEDVRTVTFRVKGEFLLHGRKVDRDTLVSAKFRYAADAPANSKPTSIQVVSKVPLTVGLKEHDVKPRDAGGKIAQASFGLFGTKVAEQAKVDFDFVVRPQ